MNNPWLNISWNNTIADCDKDYLVQVGKKEFKFGSKVYVDYINRNDAKIKQTGKGKPVELTFNNCLPEPFYGDINSDVYLLNMNPGEPDYDFCKKNDKSSEYEKACQGMLNHQPKDPGLLYDKTKGTIVYDPINYNNIINGIFANKQNDLFKKQRDSFSVRPHAGAVWQREAWKQLRGILGRDPKLFIIEYFPYHSTSGFSFPSWLPSYEYRNDLIMQAINAGKLIIIMRNEKAWYKSIGKALETYPNKVLLKNRRKIWLTPGNLLVPPGKSLNDVLSKF